MEFIDPRIFILISSILWFVFTPVFLIILLPLIFFLYKKLLYGKLSPKMITLFVKIAGYDETNFKLCDQLFAGLYGIKRPYYQTIFGIENRISFEIVGRREGIYFYVTCPESISSFVEKQIYGTYKVAEIDFIPVPKLFDRGTYNIVYELKQEMGPYTMINSFDDKQDPLKTIVSTFTKLGGNELLVYQVIISPAPNTWVKAVRGVLANAAAKEGGGLDPAFKESVEKKIAKQGFYTVIRLVSVSEDYNRAQINIDNTLASLGQFNNPKTNTLAKKLFVFKPITLRKFLLRELNVLDIHIPLFDIKLFLNNSIFNSEELSNLYHFANKELDVTGIKRTDSKQTAAPGNIPTEGIVLGKNKFRDIETIIRIKDFDRLRHQYIIGQTGSGKSVFLFSQIIQDIYRGKGLCVIDPHGPDIENLLKKIPPHREKDVIYFNAADFDRPIGINILQVLTDDPVLREIQSNIIINSFLELLRKLYDPNNQGIVGPFFEKAVRNCMLTAMTDPNATLMDVTQLLLDDKAAEKYLPNIKDQQIIDYWKIERAQMTDQTRSESMGYLTSKFSKFTQDKFIRNIVAQPTSTISIPDIMQNEKILLINLAKGSIGNENSTFLGLLLVPKVLDSAMTRNEKLTRGESFPDFYLYVDEFQNFATDAFESILSEARKFKLGLTVANQYIKQLSEKIKNAIDGNVPTKVFFKVGVDDAEYCKKMMKSFEETDFMYVKMGNAYITLCIDGSASKPFSLSVDRELVNPFKEDPEMAKRIVEHSRNTYGRDAAQIEAQINAKYASNSSAAKSETPETVNDTSKKFDDDFFGDL